MSREEIRPTGGSRAARNQFLPDGIARLAAGERTLHHEASARIARALLRYALFQGSRFAGSLRLVGYSGVIVRPDIRGSGQKHWLKIGAHSSGTVCPSSRLSVFMKLSQLALSYGFPGQSHARNHLMVPFTLAPETPARRSCRRDKNDHVHPAPM